MNDERFLAVGQEGKEEEVAMRDISWAVLPAIIFLAIAAWSIWLRVKDVVDADKSIRRFIAWRDKQKDNGQSH